MARPRRYDDDEYDDDEFYQPRRRPGGEADAPGVAGLVLGILAAVCLLGGCLTCGMTFFVAAPLAAIGTGCSAYGRGNMRVAGLVVNIVTLVPATVVFVFMVFGIGLGALAPPPPPN